MATIVAEYDDDKQNRIQVHEINGKFTVYQGERMLQKDLDARDAVRYFSHALGAIYYRLAKSEEALQATEMQRGWAFKQMRASSTVPIEPSEEMVMAGVTYYDNTQDQPSRRQLIRGLWDSMVKQFRGELE